MIVHITIYILILRRCGVVGSTLAFGSIGHGFDPSIAYFLIIVHQPSAS